MELEKEKSFPENYFPINYLNGWRTTLEAQKELEQIVTDSHTLECWRAMRKYPELKPYKFGRRVLYRVEDLQRFAVSQLQ